MKVEVQHTGGNIYVAIVTLPNGRVLVESDAVEGWFLYASRKAWDIGEDAILPLGYADLATAIRREDTPS
ncbi:MAG: hypothetical protein KC495_13780 [Dehalococcoidia bacterium]|nr:hypothetical protein [Dehalococcoidia bacterium]